jgi:hypothetical protein
MTEFDPEQLEAQYVHYFEAPEAAHSNAYQSLHGKRDSEVLRAIDRRVLAESEPFYEGDGEFRVELPAEPYERAGVAVPEDEFAAVLEAFVAEIEAELRRLFEFEDGE